MKINQNHIQYISNAVGMGTGAAVAIPVIMMLPPPSVCVMAGFSGGGMCAVGVCGALWIASAAGIIGFGIGVGYTVKKIIEVVSKRFVLDKIAESQQMMFQAVKV